MRQTTNDKFCTACAITIIVTVVSLVAFVVFGCNQNVESIRYIESDDERKLRYERISLYLEKTQG